MSKPRDLTESERSTLTNGLRVAAGRFVDHVEEFSSGPQKPAYKALADQFTKQISESLALAELIDNAESLTITEGL